MTKEENEKKKDYKVGEKIMGLGEIPGAGGLTLAGGEIVEVGKESYKVKPEVGSFGEIIKKNMAMAAFEQDIWARTLKHWNAFWENGYSDEEADKMPEDKRLEIDIKANMEFIRAMRYLNGFGIDDEDLRDDELIQKMDAAIRAGAGLKIPKLVVTIKNGELTWRAMD